MSERHIRVVFLVSLLILVFCNTSFNREAISVPHSCGASAALPLRFYRVTWSAELQSYTIVVRVFQPDNVEMA